MPTRPTRFFRPLATLAFMAILAAILPPAHAGNATPEVLHSYPLRDDLDHLWQNELLSWPLPVGVNPAAPLAIRDPKGTLAPVQIIRKGGEERLLFQATIAPLETARYDLVAATAPDPQPIRIEEDGREIRVTNGKTGVRLRKELSGAHGPFAGLATPDGRWLGDSRLNEAAAALPYRLEWSQRGPLVVEITCTLGEATLTFRMERGEPLLFIDETIPAGSDAAWTLSFTDPGLPLSHRFYRTGRGVLTAAPLTEASPFFTLQPWVQRWLEDRAKWIGLYNERDPFLLMAATRDGALWRKPGEQGPFPGLPLERVGSGVEIPLPFKAGERRWMLGLLDKAETLAVMEEKDERGRVRDLTPLPHQYVIKHEFPFERIKDYVLHWPERDTYPHLYASDALRAIIRERADQEKLSRPLKALTEDNLDDAVQHYLLSGDEETGKLLLATAQARIDGMVRVFLEQGRYNHCFGGAPHHSFYTLASGVNLIDLVLGAPFVSDAERERLRAQLAFLGYSVVREDYWSPERQYSANPNMTTMVAATQVALGALLRTHPEGKAWFDRGFGAITHQLHHWSDDNGGWLEAPHYAIASFNPIVGACLIAHQCGYSDLLFDPKIRLVGEWLAKISTPPDSRIKGWRHLPPIGNTYISETSPIFGLLSGIWREKDPAFAARMAWMHEQQGLPSRTVGGRDPMMEGYRGALLLARTTAQAPRYGSDLFPETGAVLRSGFPSDRETMLTLIAGNHYQHYDFDSGSITLWGKGRIIADDFGYYARAPESDHSRIESPFAMGDGNVMHVSDFAPQPDLDYLRGRFGGWVRQIAFLKDAAPAGLHAFLIHDSFPVPGPATWRLWLTAAEVKTEPGRATFIGKEDVDADLLFLTHPDRQPETETATRKSGAGLDANAKPGAIETTQTALVYRMERVRGINTLIVPRLKTEAPPRLVPIAGGNGVRIESEAGTDYFFLAPEPITFSEGGVRFKGTVGRIRIRPEGTTLCLGAGGEIARDAHTLVAEKPASRTWPAANR